MTHPITIAGSLTMHSSNGDGAQLLTEAAEFLNALAQMGVTLGVRIELASVAASPAVVPPVGVMLPVLRTDANGSVLPYDKDAGRTFDSEPVANPTPAAPAQPDEPPTLEAIRLRLDRGEMLFRDVPRPTRYQLVLETGRSRATDLGYPPGMAMWDQLKPTWMPTAGGLTKTTDWPTKWSDWQNLFATSMATPSGA
jgi:hypothetical protein